MNIAFFGASFVAGAGLSDKTRRFSTIVANSLPCREINFGLEGSLAVGRDDEGMLVSDDSAIARVPDVIAAAADRVLILYGEDDRLSSTQLGESGAFRQGSFLWDYDTVVRGLLGVYAPERITLVTIPATDYSLPKAPGTAISEYNDRIRNVGSRHGLRVIDPQTSESVPFSMEDFQDDGQLSPTGHKKLADIVLASIRTG